MPEPGASPIDRLTAALDRLAAAGDVEGLSPPDAAAYLGVSTAKLHDLDARGLLPSPAQLGDGRCPRWSRSELRAWLIAGAPPRLKWRVMRDAALRKTA